PPPPAGRWLMGLPLPIASPVVNPARGNTITEVWMAFLREMNAVAGTAVIGAGDVGTTELANLSVTLAKLATQIRQVTGSRGTPQNITAAGGIAPAGKWEEVIFVQGNGGAIDITANPQIAAGTVVGQTLMLIGRSSTNTL